jgi:hypothetical protein
MNGPTVYFQRESWGDVCTQHNGNLHHFCNLISMICFLQTVHGHDFNLVEVDENNYHDLKERGVFDDY